jgi:DNA-binding LacI/PurR family transcriptional regulator
MSEMKKPHPAPSLARVTLQTLADHLQLSRTTVSVVLSDAPAAQAIPKQTRERIIKAARDLDYRPNYFARSLSNGRSMSIGVLAPEISEGYFTLVMNGVEDYLRQNKYFYFLACHYNDKALIKDHSRLLMERAVDGLLFLNTPVLIPLQVPTVSISPHEHTSSVTSVEIDHQKAAVLALSHLVELGHTRIAFMKGKQVISDSGPRWKSMMDVARSLGIAIHPELNIRLQSNSWSPELGFKPVKDLLARTRDFTAIVCFNDIAAVGAVRALHEAGISVPQQVSVIGFDDVMSAQFVIPSLTTIRQPLRSMGELGARTLLERIHSPEEPYPHEILLEPELIVRESTAAAPRANM